jgi:hypothetical protein
MAQPSRVRRIKSTKSLPRVEVHWLDSALDPSFDGPIDALPESGMVTNRTIGYLVEITKHEIRLVRDATDDDNTVRWPYSIDRRAVKSVLYLDLKETGIGPS